jgi:DNA polymerase (family 10)
MTRDPTVRWDREFALVAGRKAASAIDPLVSRLAYAGSVRRMRPDVGDVDLLVIPKPGLSWESIKSAVASVCEDGRVVGRGGKLTGWVPVDGDAVKLNVFFTDSESWGAALMFTTGSRKYNVACRAFARKKGLKLNEYGVWKGDVRLPGSDSEGGICRALGIPWLPPIERIGSAFGEDRT